MRSSHGRPSVDRRVVREEDDGLGLLLPHLLADPFDLAGVDPPSHLAGDLGVEPEAEPAAGAEGELDPVTVLATDPLGEGGADRLPVVVIARELPEPVEPGSQQAARSLVGLRQLVVRVVARDDDVVGSDAGGLDVREDVLQQLARGNAEQALRGVGEEVEVAQLQDQRVRHWPLMGALGVPAGLRALGIVPSL